ncbi:thioredoxin domain-containing protein [Woodsholea maritima]|uniref:thioredoxin domain-containing protein n=1 Tax=Woodsholea maritima TaxID=240237 RepID=UPI00035F861D|nr:thioredoxin domain-containing protein [Woodsholea maritima]
MTLKLIQSALCASLLSVGVFSASLAQDTAPAAIASMIDLSERPDDNVKGDHDAPLTLIEYASVACPHCAHFHDTAMPGIEAQIAAGNVRFIFREVIAGPEQLAIAGFMLAHCAPKEDYFTVLDALFDHQDAIFEAAPRVGIREELLNAAISAGFTEDTFEACLSDQSQFMSVIEAHERSAQDGFSRTPSFVLNGKVLSAIEIEGPERAVFSLDGEPLLIEGAPVAYSQDGDVWAHVLSSLAENPPQ